MSSSRADNEVISDVDSVQNQPSRLFPLSSGNVAAYVDLKLSHRFKQFTIQYNYEQNNITRADSCLLKRGLWTNKLYSPNVLPNGMYFHSQGAWKEQGWDAPCYMFSINDHSHSKENKIHEDLDPSSAVCVYDSGKTNTSQIACVSKNKNKIFLYHIGVRDLYELKGDCIYQSHSDVSIQTIAALSCLGTGNNMLMIASSLGVITLGSIFVGKLKVEKEFNLPIEHEIEKLQLFSSSSLGLFMAYSGGEILRVWSRKDNYAYHDYTFKDFNRISVSASGKYLTAMLDIDSKHSSSVFIFDLQGMTPDTIPLDCLRLHEPVDDFVIGGEDQICFLQGDDLKYPGSLKDYLINYYEAQSKRAVERLEVLKPQACAQLPAIEAEEAPASCFGLFKKAPIKSAQNQGNMLTVPTARESKLSM